MSNNRPQPLRTVVSVIHRSAQLPVPAVVLIALGSITSAFAGMLATAGWSSFGPDPEDYLSEYEAASLTALVGIQKFALLAAVGTFVLTSVVFFVGAILVTALENRR